MNVYDFDKTIYNGDCTIDFYLYCLKRHPKIIGCMPRQLLAAVKYKLGRIEKKRFKEDFFVFLKKIKNVDIEVRKFWDLRGKYIKKWYKDQQREDDLVISASPFFLLKEVCDREGIRNLIASDVDKNTGLFHGENCYGCEKVLRFKAEYGDREIEEFYSDSMSDWPMRSLAINAFLVKGNNRKPW